jgi:hypothetical protein
MATPVEVIGHRPTVPEVGQLAEVRQRRWTVTEVAASTLPPPALDAAANARQHLVSLASVEDDGLGEELQVIWELEPGARTHEGIALPEPTGFDDPRRLDAFLDAVRWGATSTADVRALQAPFRSGIEIESYQLDPLVRAVQMPRVSLLIADDVGLGKTIEAGLVVQELIVRHRARRVLVVCPASLQLPGPRRALVTILDDAPGPDAEETALLSERALAADWSRPEEGAAWSHLQPAR